MSVRVRGVASGAVSKLVNEYGVVSADAEALLLHMAEHSCVATSPQGNRRYGDFLLTLSGGIVTDIQLARGVIRWCPVCWGTEAVDVPDGTIPCPECSVRR